MKKSILLFLLTSIFVQSQVITGTVFSKEDNLPISYAKIGVENEVIGVIADENGKYSIDLTAASSSGKIKVEVAGYEVFSENVQDFKKQSQRDIFLEYDITELTEAVITPKVLVDKNWGVNTKTKSVLFILGEEENPEQFDTETAFQFNTKKRARIQKINLNVASLSADKPVMLRYTIYSEKNGFPDKNILEEEITAELTLDKIIDGTFTIDVSDQNIWVQGKFFVAIHFLNQFNGKVEISAALLRTGYIRQFYSEWQRTLIAAPAINIDVKVDKNGKNK